MACKVCHITTVHQPTDDRIYHKECVSLAGEGYQVFLMAPIDDIPDLKDVTLISLPVFRSRWKRFLAGNIKVVTQVLKHRLSFVHFHDPELLPAGVVLRILGRKVVYDAHENISLQLKYKSWIRPSWFRKVLSIKVYWIERCCTWFFQGVVTATDDILTYVPSKKRVVLRNFPLLQWADDIEVPERTGTVPVVIYAGGLTEIRGIREMVDATALVPGEMELRLMGTFDDPEYEKACRNSTGWRKVRFLGQLPLQEVYQQVALSDIGLALLYPAENYLTSLPVKAFEYMAFGKPILMSDFPFWQEFFKGAALFCDPKDPEKIAMNLVKLLNDKHLRDQLGEEGKRKVKTEYSWEVERKKLFALYHKLTHGSKKD